MNFDPYALAIPCSAVNADLPEELWAHSPAYSKAQNEAGYDCGCCEHVAAGPCGLVAGQGLRAGMIEIVVPLQ